MKMAHIIFSILRNSFYLQLGVSLASFPWFAPVFLGLAILADIISDGLFKKIIVEAEDRK